MKKILLILCLMVMSFSHALEFGKYHCKIYPNKSRQATMTFNFEFADEELKCFERYASDDDYCMKFFQFNPVDQIDFYLDGLYDGGFGYDPKDDFVVSSDSDGCDIGRLTLYAKSGYRKGYITSTFRCSGPLERNAGDVYCTRQ